MNFRFYPVLTVLVIYLPLSCFSPSPLYSSIDITALNLTNVSTICKLQMNESALKNILQLMHKSTTQIVEIAIFMYSKNKTRNFPMAWANEIGRTIISLIAETSPAQPWYFNTLSIGIEEVNIVVFEENYGCLPTGSDGTDMVFQFVLRQLSKIEDYDNYKLCHKEDSEIYKCCNSVTGYENLILCADYSSIVLRYAHEYITWMTVIIVILIFPIILKYLHSFKKERKHYEISDSPMAFSSIFRAVLFEEKGPVKSAHRRLVFSLTVTGILYFSELDTTWAVVASFWIIPFTALDTFAIRCSVIDEELDISRQDMYIKLFTLPFNFKYWRKFFKPCFKKILQDSNYQQIEDNQDDELPVWKKIHQFFEDLFFVFVYLVSFIFICFFVLVCLIFLWLLHMAVPSIIVCPELVQLFPFMFIILSLVLVIRCLISFLRITLLLIAGFYLNGEFYSPIVVPTMILIVYCWKCWRSFVETKYIQLKTRIYEVCEELANENSVLTEIENNTSMPTNGANSSDDERNAEEIDDCRFTVNVKTGMISKDLYEELRERYLPYDEVLFWFFVRLFTVANFCLFVSVMMLFSQISGVSGELQIISTMAVGTLPFIFDAIWADHTLEQKEVANMKLKLMLRQAINFESKTGNVIMVGIA